MIPAEVKTPQISVREKCSSFALLSNQVRACSSITLGPDSLDTALSMLELHSGSLYSVDMDLKEWETKHRQHRCWKLFLVFLSFIGYIQLKSAKSECCRSMLKTFDRIKATLIIYDTICGPHCHPIFVKFAKHFEGINKLSVKCLFWQTVIDLWAIFTSGLCTC